MEPVLLEEKPPSKLAMLSMIMGFLSALAFVLWSLNPAPFFFPIPIITGLISGIIGTRSIRQIKAKNMSGIRIAIAGIVLGCVPIGIVVITMIFVFVNY